MKENQNQLSRKGTSPDPDLIAAIKESEKAVAQEQVIDLDVAFDRIKLIVDRKKRSDS